METSTLVDCEKKKDEVNRLSISRDEKNLLEWELSLDSSDIRSHAWYHGNISRVDAESLVKENGQFLVRDSSSKPGEYILTCKLKENSIHFVINKHVITSHTSTPHIQYSFESGNFDTIPALIIYHVGSCRPITASSGAIISGPINRTVPLNISKTNGDSTKQDLTELVIKKSYSQTWYDYPRKSNKTDAKEIYETLPKSSSSINSQSFEKESARFSGLSEISGFSNLSLSGSNSYDYLRPCNEPFYVNWKVAHLNSNYSSEDFAYYSDYSDKEHSSSDNSPSNYLIYSKRNPIHFKGFLLPFNNKPLDGKALTKVKDTLLENASRVLAGHLTQTNLELIGHTSNNISSASGLELLTHPAASLYREDFLDRAQCLNYFVQITILTCQGERVRSTIIEKWIQIASECKIFFGDTLAFYSIMKALTSEHIKRLEKTWSTIRHHYTENAVLFESKLEPIFKNMQNCKEPLPPNTTIPFIIPIVETLVKQKTPKSLKLTVNIENYSVKVKVIHFNVFNCLKLKSLFSFTEC